MVQPIRSVPVVYDPRTYQIETHRCETERSLTLLELIQAVNETSESEQELIATVVYMLRSGRIHLAGNFRHARIEQFCD